MSGWKVTNLFGNLINWTLMWMVFDGLAKPYCVYTHGDDTDLEL